MLVNPKRYTDPLLDQQIYVFLACHLLLKELRLLMSIDIRKRFATKPGTSLFMTTGSFPKVVMSVLTLDGLVACEETARYLDRLSDRGGAKKCVPQTLSGLPVVEARSVMEMEEVLVRRRALGARISSSDANASFFGATLSTMASIAASTPPRPPFWSSSGCARVLVRLLLREGALTYRRERPSRA